MANRRIKPGDYILTNNKEIFRVTDIHVDTFGTYYDIRSLKSNSYYKSVPRNRIRHLGKVIPEEKAGKAIKILY